MATGATSYSLGFRYGPGVYAAGELWISKVVDRWPAHNVRSIDQGQPPLTDRGRSYFMQLDVIGSAAPQITGRLFDEEGGTELLTVSWTDTATLGGEPFTSGASGVFAAEFDAPRINATFDNVRSIPEPSTVVLLAVAALVLAGCAWRRYR